jgi:hypothetical protein
VYSFNALSKTSLNLEDDVLEPAKLVDDMELIEQGVWVIGRNVWKGRGKIKGRV